MPKSLQSKVPPNSCLASVIPLTDDTGAVTTQYAYDPLGSIVATTEAFDNPFQYTGRENNSTGQCYYRARYYDPGMQRFVSEDPIGLAGETTKPLRPFTN